MAGDRESPLTADPEKDEAESEGKRDISQFSETEEMDGKLAHSETLDKLMHSVLDDDKGKIEDGHVITDSTNNGLQSFTPDLMFEQLTSNYKQAKQLMGDRLLRALTGYDSDYIERNVRIPEFKRELKERLRQGVQGLKDRGVIDEQGVPTKEGMVIASIATVMDELERMNKKGVLGERASSTQSHLGEKADYTEYTSQHRYKDLAVKATVKKALRRGHQNITKDDLVAFTHVDKQRATIMYAIDSSGSMKGEKIAAAKRAGIALAYKAIRKKDRVGCLIFGKNVDKEQLPTQDFVSLVNTIMKARASQETDIAQMIRRSTELIGHKTGVKHLIILTDGIHTVGSDADVLEAATEARNTQISISVVGLKLDEEGENLSKKIVNIGEGTLYTVQDYDNLDVLLIEEYYRMKR